MAPQGMLTSAGTSLAQTLAMVLFLVAALIKVRAILRQRRLIDGATFWCGATISTLVVLGCVAWFSLTNIVWFWDFLTYSAESENLANEIRSQGVIHALALVRASLSDENNLIPALPLALIETAFGRSDRVVLILAIAAVYVAPSILAGAYLLQRLTGSRLSGRTALLIMILALMVYPVLLYAPLNGMPDFGGLAIIVLILMSSWRRGNASELSLEDVASLIICGGALVLLCLFRRWYLFIAPPIIVVIAVREFLRPKGPTGLRERFRSAAGPMLIVGSYAALCGLAFYWARLLVIIKADYGNQFQAYAQTYAAEVGTAAYRLGYGPLLIGLAATLFLMLRRQTRLLGVSAAATICSIIVLFERVQGFSPQHYLLVVPVLAFAIAVAVAWIHVARPIVGRAVIALLGFSAVLTGTSVLAPQAHTVLQNVGVVPRFDLRPPQRPDMAELHRLVYDLERYVAAGHTICVVASGFVLNQQVVFEDARNSGTFTRSPFASQFVWLGDVDRRDGPARDFPRCDYAVLSTPVNLHLGVERQQVIAYLDQQIKSGIGLGGSFRPTGQSYSLMDGYQAQIYQRTGPFNPEDWDRYLTAVAHG